jgi:hypothetical protein
MTHHYFNFPNIRATVDVNRGINEAAQNCPNAETAFSKYHGTIRSIIAGFTQGKGLLLDIHGQVRKKQSKVVQCGK